MFHPMLLVADEGKWRFWRAGHSHVGEWQSDPLVLQLPAIHTTYEYARPFALETEAVRFRTDLDFFHLLMFLVKLYWLCNNLSLASTGCDHCTRDLQSNISVKQTVSHNLTRNDFSFFALCLDLAMSYLWIKHMPFWCRWSVVVGQSVKKIQSHILQQERWHVSFCGFGIRLQKEAVCELRTSSFPLVLAICHHSWLTFTTIQPVLGASRSQAMRPNGCGKLSRSRCQIAHLGGCGIRCWFNGFIRVSDEFLWWKLLSNLLAY